jgi:dynactin complex subunit
MPKIVITEDTLPVALHLLDQWSGKLTWDEYAKKLGEALGITVTQGAIKKHSQIQAAYTAKKKALREKAESAPSSGDVTIDSLMAENEALESKVRRLEKEINLYKEQFVRWQHNLYMMPGVDMDGLNANLDKPLVAVDRVSG